jgi:hypothetical protein
MFIRPLYPFPCSVSFFLHRLKISQLALCLLGTVLALTSASALAQTAVIAPAGVSVHSNGTQKFTVTVTGAQNPNGSWYVLGGIQNGVIDQDGTYHAPNLMPASNVVTFGFIYNGSNNNTTQQLTITNPVPIITSTNPGLFNQLNFNIFVAGSSFLPGSVISVQGKTYPTFVNNGGQLYAGNITLTSPPVSGTIPVTVTNPDPGSSSITFNVPSVFPGASAVSPSTLSLGWNTVTVTGTGFTRNSVVTLDGRPMATTYISSTSLSGYGYEAAWKTGTSVVGVIPTPGAPSESNTTVNIQAATIPYNTAARFATQAALGPRPDIVEHIQKIGLKPFLTEQFKQPGVIYSPNDAPRLDFLRAAVQGNSLLRQRVALALNSYIPNQAIFIEYASFVPWEQKLETDAFGNYRQILTDITSDPRLGNFLSNAGNDVSNNPGIHPTQNFARELMQLFSLGTSLLNDDGTYQLDSNGQPLPTYDQSTVLDLSRALTGWDLPTPVNPVFTAFQIDESQPLTPVDAHHDHGAKVLFGNVNLPAGQTPTQDRDQALNAIFNHPNLPPFISTILIHRLVTSNPSPAYIQRVATVFKNNGKGVRGDMPSVLCAIFLDKEARAGDTATVPTDGFFQDPVLFQIFATSALQQPGEDSQQVYVPAQLGEDLWHPNTVFDFYPQTYNIPGTAINSPEFSLFNNLSALQRSRFLYGIVSGTQPGFGTEYMPNSWLFNAFTDVPDLVDGLNHLLYHGQMSTAQQAAILSYCSSISDQKQAFTSAIFLALNGDSYNVSH